MDAKGIRQLFQEIEEAKDLFHLQQIAKKQNWESALAEIDKKYPFLPFRITEHDLQQLRDEGILDKQGKLQPENVKFDHPLHKLLWSLAWKNGDLHKLQHILDGITHSKNSVSTQNIIFRQFGKSLYFDDEPIVDQHVLRAYGCAKKPENFEYYRHKSVYKNNDEAIIDEYRRWFKDLLRLIDPKKRQVFAQYVDRLLFIAGKSLKK